MCIVFDTASSYLRQMASGNRGRSQYGGLTTIIKLRRLSREKKTGKRKGVVRNISRRSTPYSLNVVIPQNLAASSRAVSVFIGSPRKYGNFGSPTSRMLSCVLEQNMVRCIPHVMAERAGRPYFRFSRRCGS
jgi:hypothetical protein